MRAAAVAGGAGKRWWLWGALLALSAWLVIDDRARQPGDTATLSLPTRTRPPATPTSRNPEPEVLEPLVPREIIIAAPDASGSSSAQLPMRDLFSGRTWALPPPPPAVQATPAPSAPPLPFVFLGKKQEADGWEVYLARGEQTFIVREGNTFDSSYRADKIAPPSLSVTYLPLGQVQNLSIGDTR